LFGEFDMTGSYAASFLPWILIPVITWLMPVVVMGLLFIYIESDA
jgi:photosystem I subunit 8